MANTHVQGMSGRRESIRETEKEVGRRRVSVALSARKLGMFTLTKIG